MGSALIPLIAAGAGAVGQGLSAITGNAAQQQAQQQFLQQLALEQQQQAQIFGQQNEAQNTDRANATALAPARLQLLKAMYAKAGLPVPASLDTNPVAQSTTSAAGTQLASLATRIQQAQQAIQLAQSKGVDPQGNPIKTNIAGYIASIQKAIQAMQLQAQQLSGQVGKVAGGVTPVAGSSGLAPTPGAAPAAASAPAVQPMPPTGANPSLQMAAMKAVGAPPTPPAAPAAPTAPVAPAVPPKPMPPVLGGPGGATQQTPGNGAMAPGAGTMSPGASGDPNDPNSPAGKLRAALRAKLSGSLPPAGTATGGF